MGKFKASTPAKKTAKAPKEPEYVSRDIQDYSSEADDDMDGNMAFGRRDKGDDEEEEDDDVFNLKGSDSDDSEGDSEDDSEDDEMVSVDIYSI